MVWQWKKRGGGRGLERGGRCERGRMGGERGGEVKGLDDSQGDRRGVGGKWQEAH